MNKTDKVLLNIEGSIAMVMLNRPERLNALDDDVYLGLKDAAEIINDAPDVRVTIVTGAGDRAFCAGLDLKAVMEGQAKREEPPFGIENLQRVSNVFTMYENMAVPVIAAINGYCIGGGVELALACDIRLASDTAIFSIPEVVYGVIPDGGGTQRLPRVVGPGKAKELIYTGRRIDAQEALRIGLINAVHPQERLMAEARLMADQIAALKPAVVQGAKRALNVAMSYSMDMGLNYETAIAAYAIGKAERLAQQATDFTQKKKD